MTQSQVTIPILILNERIFLSLCHNAGPDPNLSDVMGDWRELEVEVKTCLGNYPVSVALSQATRPHQSSLIQDASSTRG